MARIRTNNVFGTTTDNPLTNVATTMNSAGLANLAAVTGSDEALITLDPNRVNGAPEIVRVTAHTGSATSATIDRAEFGTTAREHPAGTEWVHGAVAATASDPDGDFGGFWEAFTPSNTNVTIGNGTQVARTMRIGRTVFVHYSLVFGSTTAFSGNAQIGLPVPAASTIFNGMHGSAYIIDSGTTERPATTRQASGSTTQVLIVHGVSGAGIVNATSPMTWTTNDAVGFTLVYEAAT
jgi:hypothetical protein